MIYDEQKRQKATDAPPPPPKKLEREPQAIVMSHAEQEVVEKMLKDRNPRRVVDGKGGVREEWKRLEHRLMRDGFSKEDIHQAMHQATQRPTGSFSESVLDWLCFHLDEYELPASFNKRKLRHALRFLDARMRFSGSKTHTVGVIKASAEEEASDDEMEWSETEDPDVDTLLQYGYRLPEILQALHMADGDPLLAHRLLYTQLTGAIDTDATGNCLSRTHQGFV